MAEENGLTFSVAYGLDKRQLQGCGLWWADDQHGHYSQPLEFIALRGESIVESMYTPGAVGRMHVGKVLTSIQGLERRRLGT